MQDNIYLHGDRKMALVEFLYSTSPLANPFSSEPCNYVIRYDVSRRFSILSEINCLRALL
jgi:hypothetical protein